MQRTYLSREMTRAMALDHPIGDPFGGPAYGEKNGPAIAIIGAAMTIEVGITMLATNLLVGGLMIAGGVLSGLGAITGNETLSKLGMIAGLAGSAIGVGTMGFDGFMNAAKGAFTDDKGISGMFGGTENAFASTNSQQGMLMNGLGDTADVAAGTPSTFNGGGSMTADGAANALKSSESTLTSSGPTNIFGTRTGSGSLVEAGTNTAGLGFNDGKLASSGSNNWMKDFWGGLDSTGKSTLAQAGLKAAGGFADGLMKYPQTQDELALMEQKVLNDTTKTETEKQLALQKIKESQAVLDAQNQKTANKNSTNFASLIPGVAATPYNGMLRNGTATFTNGVA